MSCSPTAGRGSVITRDFIADLFEIRLRRTDTGPASAAVASPEHVAQLIDIEGELERAFLSPGNRRHHREHQAFHRALHHIRPIKAGHRPDPPALRTRLIGTTPLRNSNSGSTRSSPEHNGLIDACRRRDGGSLQDSAHALQHSIDRAPAAYSQVRAGHGRPADISPHIERSRILDRYSLHRCRHRRRFDRRTR